MQELTAEQFAQRAFQMNLLDQQQLASTWGSIGSRDVSPDDFRNILLRNELLTNYQVDRLMRGEKDGFFYGDYKVLYLVGTGSFARVYRAVHKDTHKIVAVKVLRKRHCDKKDETAKFVREGEMGSSLRHPNIVPIYEVHSEARNHFFVMAFVEGQSLRDFARIRKKVEPLEATQILSGIVSGLSHAFEKGITHRDLKLSNVLISSDGQPQLVDFGLAGIESDPEGGGNARAIDYAALERATGAQRDDPRSDIYFAGCMYYNLLTGVAPLPDIRDRVQRLSRARFDNIKPIRSLLNDIPLAVENVVKKSMEMNPDARYSRPVEMLVDLNKATKALKTIEAASPVRDEGDTAVESSEQTVMLVESNERIQNTLRTALKKLGYRVLVIRSPDRAMHRLKAESDVASCVIVSTHELGDEALKLFLLLGRDQHTKTIPAVLLLTKMHAKIGEKLQPTEYQAVLSMPIKMSEIHATIQKLVDV